MAQILIDPETLAVRHFPAGSYHAQMDTPGGPQELEAVRAVAAARLVFTTSISDQTPEMKAFAHRVRQWQKRHDVDYP